MHYAIPIGIHWCCSHSVGFTSELLSEGSEEVKNIPSLRQEQLVAESGVDNRLLSLSLLLDRDLLAMLLDFNLKFFELT